MHVRQIVDQPNAATPISCILDCCRDRNHAPQAAIFANSNQSGLLTLEGLPPNTTICTSDPIAACRCLSGCLSLHIGNSEELGLMCVNVLPNLSSERAEPDQTVKCQAGLREPASSARCHAALIPNWQLFVTNVWSLLLDRCVASQQALWLCKCCSSQIGRQTIMNKAWPKSFRSKTTNQHTSTVGSGAHRKQLASNWLQRHHHVTGHRH